MGIETRFLLCTKCAGGTPHRFDGTYYRHHSYIDSLELRHKSDGLKDIWQCTVCGEKRIYGAPLDRFAKRKRGRPRKQPQAEGQL